MFIVSATNDRAPFGGAECYWIDTGQLEFRPSERRRRVGAIPFYNPYGVATWPC